MTAGREAAWKRKDETHKGFLLDIVIIIIVTLSFHTFIFKNMPAVSTQDCFKHADRLNGRVVLITGAASGFGRACASTFAKHGAKLVLGDVDKKGLEVVKKEVEQAGG